MANNTEVSLEDLDKVVDKFKLLTARLKSQNDEAQKINTKISIALADLERVKKEAVASFGTSDKDELNQILFERFSKNNETLSNLESNLDKQELGIKEAKRQLAIFDSK